MRLSGIEASTALTLPESEKAIIVKVQGLPEGIEWRGISLVDSSGKMIPAIPYGFGFSFVPKSGETYTVKGIR